MFFLIRIENNIDLYSELCFFFKNSLKTQLNDKKKSSVHNLSVHTERNKIITVKQTLNAFEYTFTRK